METKRVKGDYADYLKFGWSFVSDEKVRHGKLHVVEHNLERDTNCANYSKISELEKKYFSLKAQIKTYEPINGLWCFFAFLILVIPAIIYVAYKSKQRNDIEMYNSNIRRQMKDILDQVSNINC